MNYGDDICTEPDGDPDTLANLGPLRALAGVFEGTGHDEHPAAEGIERDAFFEHYELQPIDRQTNGPQLFHGLRYHTHIVKPGEVETFHEQVGFWLWEPAAETVTLTLGIPRSQALLAAVRRLRTRRSSSSWRTSVPRRTVFCRIRSSIARSARSPTGFTSSYTTTSHGRTRRKAVCRSPADRICSVTSIATH